MNSDNVTSRRSEEKDYEKFRLNFARTLELMGIYLWEFDAGSGMIHNILGVESFLNSSDDYVGYSDWLNMINEEDRGSVETCVGDIISGKSDYASFIYRIGRKSSDGHMWLRTAAKIRTRDDSGAALKITGVSQDITASRELEDENIKREERLRENESRLKNAMKIGRLSTWEYDFEKGVILTDSRMTDILGLAEYHRRGEPITIEKVATNIYFEDRHTVIEKFYDSVNNHKGMELIFRIESGGSIIFIHLVSEVIFGDDGKPLRLVGVAQDITQMKNLEDSLEKQYEGLRLISNRAGLGLWTYDAANGFISVLIRDDNLEGGDNIYRKIPVESLMEKISPEDAGMVQSKFRNDTGREGDVREMDIRIHSGDEVYRWLHITAVIEKTDAYGRPLIYKGLYQDITERKDIEERLYQSQKMEAIGRLAGGIAHDFNNLLQVILGYGSLVLMDAGENTELLENITHIIDSGEKAKGLIKQLLLFSKKERFRPSPVSINELIASFIKMLKRVIGENITLNFNPEKEVHFIHGDVGQLEQVFMNLCINAKDAIHGIGSIIIKTRDITIDDYWPCFDNRIPPGTYVMISISDTGAGIPADLIKQVFEPFFSTKDRSRGTGLGLATVYSIVKQHGGYIDVFSLEGNGTTFTIYLPVVGEIVPDVRSYERDTDAKRLRGRETVLFAEDDELIRKYTERILTDYGYRVITAEDGEMAVELFKQNMNEINLLILDVIMPKKNGWDAYNEINSLSRDIPVLFLSGYDQNLLPVDAADKFPMVYVQKPFKYYTIIKAVDDLLNMRNV